MTYESRPLVGSAQPTECRLIIDPPATGPWNMGVDEALLLDAIEQDVVSLRFYQWSVPTLSLGYFQHYGERNQHEPSRGCAIVRRQTGGGAILHDRELTYSLALPANHPLAAQAQILYAAAHGAFIATIASLRKADARRWVLMRSDQESNSSRRREPFLCFERRARGDVLLAPLNEDGGAIWKIVGSAQRRHRGAVLQHGSLLLEKSPAAPELPGLRDLTGEPFPIGDMVLSISVRLAATLGIRPSQSKLPAELQSMAEELANTKYGRGAWTNRR